MRLNLLLFNAHGLNDEARLDYLHRYLHNFQPRLDIVAIQEHKLCRMPSPGLVTAFGTKRSSLGLRLPQGMAMPWMQLEPDVVGWTHSWHPNGPEYCPNLVFFIIIRSTSFYCRDFQEAM